MCMYVQDIKFLWSNLCLGGLSRDVDDANTPWTIHDYKTASAFMHFVNKFLYQKCWDTLFMYVHVSICVFVCLSLYLCVYLSLCLFVSVLCVKVLKEELKFVSFSINNKKNNELDAFQKCINTSNTKRIHYTVYLNAYCAWEKNAKCENL